MTFEADRLGDFQARARDLIDESELVHLDLETQLAVRKAQGLSTQPADLQATISLHQPMPASDYLEYREIFGVEADNFYLALQLDEFTPLSVRRSSDVPLALEVIAHVLVNDIEDDSGNVDRRWASLDVASETFIYALTVSFEEVSTQDLEAFAESGSLVLLHHKDQGHAQITENAERVVFERMELREGPNR